MLLYSLWSVFLVFVFFFPQSISSSSWGQQGVSIIPGSELKSAFSSTSVDDSQASFLATGPKTFLLSSAHVPMLNDTMGLWRAWSQLLHSHVSDRVLIFKQQNVRDQWANRRQAQKTEKPATLETSLQKMISHSSAISDINISQIVFPISKEFIFCKHLQNAWCWGLLQI